MIDYKCVKHEYEVSMYKCMYVYIRVCVYMSIYTHTYMNYIYVYRKIKGLNPVEKEFKKCSDEDIF